MLVLAFFLLGVLAFALTECTELSWFAQGGDLVLGASVLCFSLRPVTVGSMCMAVIRGFFL